jgi:hypothetical protein
MVIGPELVDQLAYDEQGNILPDAPRKKVSKLIKSSTPYDTKVIGILSNNYSDFTSTGYHIIADSDNPKPVALSGRVPVKIAPDSEAIQPGDFLTTSSTPGRATKATQAGQVIGKALDSWDSASGKDQIIVFVEQGYFNGLSNSAILGLTGDAAQLAQFIGVASHFSTDVNNNLVVNGDTTFTGTITVDKIKANQIEGLEVFTDKLTSLSDKLATSSATLTPTPIPTPVVLGNITIESAKVNLDLQVLGNLTVNSSFTVKGLSEFYGKAVFYEAADFEITPVFNKDMGGFAVIKQGDREVLIAFEKEYAYVPVVTANAIWDADRATLDVMKQLGTYILPKQDFIVADVTTKGFTILLQDPTVTDLKFSWVALVVKDVKTFVSGASVVATPTPTPTSFSTPAPTDTPLPTATPIPTASPTATPM